MSSVPHKKRKKYNLILFWLILLYLFPSFYFGIKDYFYYKTQVNINKERLNRLTKEVKELREIVENLNDPYIIEKLAREKLFMARPGEIPVIIIEEESRK
ncbi:MAG: FtsB family cell division protein [Dictyoglomaceae bacterium]